MGPRKGGGGGGGGGGPEREVFVLYQSLSKFACR